MACENEGRFWADTLFSVTEEASLSLYISGILPFHLMLHSSRSFSSFQALGLSLLCSSARHLSS
jgi:hypothetical protein